MKTRLTERQNQAFEFIRDYLRHHNRPPTLKEIGEGLAIRSTNGVFKLLRVLENKGYIVREQGTARGIELVDPDTDSFHSDMPMLPVAGRASSFQPEMLFRTRNFMCVDPLFIRKSSEESCLIARAGDDGMHRDGIFKGDYLIIEKCEPSDVSEKGVAAFLVGEQLQARYLTIDDGQYHLQPADRTYTDDFFPQDSPECHFIGRVVGIMRSVAV